MAEFKLSRLKFTWKGAWEPNFNYIPDDVVSFGGKSYVCIEQHTSSTQSFYADKDRIDYETVPPSSAPRWELMFDGYAWTGDWTPSNVYNLGDLVKYKGIVYACIESHTAAATINIGLEADILKWVSYARTDEWRGNWTPATVYSERDVVKYGGILYRCVARNAASDVSNGLEANFADWEIVNPAQQWRDNWATSIRYRNNDIVRYGGIVYRCIEGHTSADTYATGLEPDLAKWEIVHSGVDYKHDWAPDTRYKVNDVVKYGPGLWICQVHHTSDPEDFDTNWWGVYIEGYQYDFAWDSNTAYQKGDVVKYGGYSYVAINNNINSIPSAIQSDESTLVIWKLLTVGYTIAGEWTENTAYFVGQVVRRNGQYYAAIKDSVSDPNVNDLAWELLIPGEKYRKEWLDNTLYAIGDVVVFEANTYRCIALHTSSFNSRPDNDYDNVNWVLFIQGEPTNSLRYQGDIKVFDVKEDGSTIGQSRLAIGDQGQALRVVGNSPSWEDFNFAQKVYYVGTDGTDAAGYGLTLNAPFRTLAYACSFASGPATIFVKVGTYSEILPIKVPRDVAIVGEELRSTIIEPAPGSELNDMFHVNNASGIRNMTLRGLTGTLGPINQYGTRRPSGGSYVSLDPGLGPDDSSVWITTRSCYVQNVTTFGTGCIGMKVDGDLHNGGNKSIVANDFTQVLSDGIGIWVTNNALSELVSVFSYYGHIGYLAENGGKIRATNGNSSYGSFGVVAEGVDETEQPVDATVNNRTTHAVVYDALSGEANDEILNFEYLHAGENYTTATASFIGSGVSASVVMDEFRDGGIYEWRLLDPVSGGILGGTGFQNKGNNAQGGNTTGINIASNDEALPGDYIGMRIIITSGTGTGQYGIVGSYDEITKRIDVYNEYDGSLGWTHVIAGYPLATLLDTTTVYRIEPRPVTAAPDFTASTYTGTISYYREAAFGEQNMVVCGSSGDSAEGRLYVGNDETSLTAVQPASSPQQWTDVAYDATNGVFVAVSTFGIQGISVYSTDDGETWSEVIMASPNCTRVAYGGGKWVSVGPNASGFQYSNSPSISWVNGSFGFSGSFVDVAYGKGKFVIIDETGKTAYSTNGTTWTQGNDIPAYGDSTQPTWLKVTYGNNRFVAISTESDAVAYSFDGATWYLSQLPYDTAWSDISYGAGLFVASSANNSNLIAVSDSGGTKWELKQLPTTKDNACALYIPGSNNRWISFSNQSGFINTFRYGATFRCRPVIASGRVSFVKIWEPGSGYTDQPTFQLVDPLHTSDPVYDFRIGNGVLSNPTFLNRGVGYKTSTTRVTITGDGYADRYSSTGNLVLDGMSRIVRTGANFELNLVNWTPSITPIDGEFYGVTASDDKFYAITNSPAGANQVIYSSDGIGWTSVSLPTQLPWTDLKYGGGVLIGIAYGDTYVRSEDGLTWSAFNFPQTNNWKSIGYDDGVWVVVAYDTDIALYSVDDGVTWQEATLPISAKWTKVKHAENTFIAIAEQSNKVAVSSNGQSWTARTVPATADWSDLAYGNGLVIAVAKGSNDLMYSADLGDTWTAGTTPEVDDWSSILFSNRKFIMFSESSSACYTTRDGIEWISREMPIDSVFGATVGLNKYLAMSTNTTAVASDGVDNRVYRVLTVQELSGSPGNYRLAVRVSPDFTRTTSPAHGAPIEIREKYSQVRLTGHDFLDIGTGNFEQTNYPELYEEGTLTRAPENEVYYKGGGRCFYTSTDQDGNFRVGELFAVEQATGVVTISADYFDLGGLSELRLGGIRVGGTGVVIREFSTDVTFSADSNNVIPTERAIKAYISRRISGGGSDAATGRLIAGTVSLGPDSIGSTTGTTVQLPVKVNITKGIGGVLLAHSFFTDSFNSGLEYQELGRDLA